MGRVEENKGLVELFLRYYRYKWVLFGIIFLGGIVGVVVALSLPKVYTSDALARIVSHDGASSVSGLGGLASIAGLGGGSDNEFQAKYALEVIHSRSFLKELIERSDMLVDLVAVKSWDSDTDEAIYNEDIYDPSANIWLVGESTQAGKRPPFHLVYSRYKKLIDMEYDKSTSIVKFKVTHPSPIFSSRLVELIIDQANTSLKREKVQEAGANIEYIYKELEKTNVSSMRTVLINLLAEQKRLKMLAEVKREYVFAVIDPPVVPSMPAGPSRILIVMLACTLSTILGVLLLAVWFVREDYIRDTKEIASLTS